MMALVVAVVVAVVVVMAVLEGVMASSAKSPRDGFRRCELAMLVRQLRGFERGGQR